MMARSSIAPSTGRIQKRKTNVLQIIIFGLQRAAGPYRGVNRVVLGPLWPDVGYCPVSDRTGYMPERSRRVRLRHCRCPKQSIEPQGRAKLFIIHAGKIVSRINITCQAKEEILECSGSARTLRINHATKGDLY
jgi:hypothetical protein